MATWKGTVTTVNNLETEDTTYFPNYTCYFCLENNNWYYLDTNSTNTADGVDIITASPQGRWIAINNDGTLTVKTTGTEPTTIPVKANLIEFYTTSGKLFFSIGSSSVDNWVLLNSESIKFGNNDPTSLSILPDFVNQLFVNTANGLLYRSSDGTNWTKLVIKDDTKTTTNVGTTSPSSNPLKIGDFHYNKNTKELFVASESDSYEKVKGTENTQLIIDVSNSANYANFNDVVDPVDFQVYFVPPFVDIATYDVQRYGDATVTTGDKIAYLNKTVELASNYDFSGFVETNGEGWYIFIPTQYSDPDYLLSGATSGMNFGLEFSVNTNPAVAKIYNFTEGAVGTESLKVGATTLNGNCQALYVSSMNFQANLKLVPYENLTDGSLK